MPKTLKSNKGILGKLLASENIRIEYQAVKTASFDMTNRVLTLPLWGVLSDDVLDLFVGHEVGHALYTPAEGWNAAYDKNSNAIYHHVIQIVEDIRIERKIKARYPGLVKPMYRGYDELVQAKFFDCTYEEMPYLPFLDRLNLFFKLGVRSGVSFTKSEQPTIRRLEVMSTWDDALSMINEVWKIQMSECEDYNLIAKNPIPLPNEDSSTQERRKVAETVPSGMKKKQDKWLDKILDTKGESFTYDSFEKKAGKLTNAKRGVDYMTLPTLDLNKYVLSHKTTHFLIEAELGQLVPDTKMEARYVKFVEDHQRTVNYMAKEFELRKSAKQTARGVTGKTGELDLDRVWKHRLSPELFVQRTIIPGGKSHGMMLVMDLSGSMMKNIRSTMEQVIILTMFCRRVGIPFEVYGFIENGYFKQESRLLGFNQFERWRDAKIGEYTIYNENFRMKQLLSSTMKAQEYRTAVRNLLSTSDFLAQDHHKMPSMIMHGTPLVDALVVTRQLIKEFQTKTRCEVMTTIFLTDGDGGGKIYCRSKTSVDELVVGDRIGFVDPESRTTMVVDKPMWKIGHVQSLLMDMIRESTGTRIIGFYLVARKFKELVEQDTDIIRFDKAWEAVQKNHYHLAIKEGYDKFYLIPANKLELGKVEWVDVSQVADANKRSRMLTTSLRKIQKQKMVSKLFLNNFIQNVA